MGSDGHGTGRTVTAGLLASGAAGTLFAWSVVGSAAAAELGAGSAGAAVVFGVGLASFTATVLLAGPVADRQSPRLLLVVAAALCGAGLLTAAGAPSLVVVVAGVGGLFAAGSGLGYLVALRVAARTSEAVRARVIGVVVAGYAATPIALGLVGPTVVAALGWRRSLAALALVVPPLLAVGAAVVPRRPAAASRPSGPRAVVRSQAVPLLWLVFACGSAPGLAAFAQALDLGVSLGLSHATAGWSLVALSAGNLAGRLVAGVAAGRSGMLPALTTCVLAQAAAVAVASAGVAGWVVLAALLVVGTCYGGLSALVPAATAEVADPAEFGRVYGRVFTGWGLAGLAAPVLAAHLATDAGWTTALRWALVPLLAAGIALAVLARLPGRSGDRL